MAKARGWRALALACAWIGIFGLSAAPASASEAGWRIGSAVSSAVYAPAKAFYAATGLLVGGIGWGISGGNREVAQSLIDPAVRGDYWVTPEHLRGERRLEFVGRPAVAEPIDTGVAGQEGLEGLDEDAYYGY